MKLHVHSRINTLARETLVGNFTLLRGFLLRRGGGGGRNDDDHFSHLRRWICSWWRASTCDEISILRRSCLLLLKHDYDNDDENEGDDDNDGDDHDNGD